MTALRFHSTARPSLIGARVEPMSAQDHAFWAILAERRKAASAHHAPALAQLSTAAEARGRMQYPREPIWLRLFGRKP